MLIFLIVTVLLRDGTSWQTEIQFYSAEDCRAEGEAFDVFMATRGDLWVTYHASCETEPPEGEFEKREAALLD